MCTKYVIIHTHILSLKNNNNYYRNIHCVTLYMFLNMYTYNMNRIITTMDDQTGNKNKSVISSEINSVYLPRLWNVVGRDLDSSYQPLS